jgi:hypothetical protein
LTFVAPYILASALRSPGQGVRNVRSPLRATKNSEAGFRFYDPQTIE